MTTLRLVTAFLAILAVLVTTCAVSRLYASPVPEPDPVPAPPVAAPLTSGCACDRRGGVVLTREDPKKSFTSPNYPRPYCRQLDCGWEVVATAPISAAVADGQGTGETGSAAVEGERNVTRRIKFLASNVDLRPRVDSILFYEHRAAVGSKPSANCTGRMKLCEYTSRGAYLLVRFSTGSGVVDSYGFGANVTLLEEVDGQPITPTTGGSPPPSWSTIGLVVAILLALLLCFVASYLAVKCRRKMVGGGTARSKAGGSGSGASSGETKRLTGGGGEESNGAG